MIITLHIVPRSSKSQVAGMHGDALKVRLHAPPVDGKANKALLRFLAHELGNPASSLVLLSGHQSRRKQVLIRRAEEADVRRRLGTP